MTTRSPDRRALPATFRFRPRVERLEPAHARLGAFGWLERLSHHRDPVLLEGPAGEPRRFELLGLDPLPGEPPGSWEELAGFVRRLAPDGGDAPPAPFAGGFLGALAYELGPPDEALALPADPWGLSPVLGGSYVDYLLLDHGRDAAWLVLGDEPGDGRPPLGARRDALLDALATPPPARRMRALGEPVSHESGALHRDRIERVRAEIARGEIYQANLSRRFSRTVAGDPLALYARLRALHPTPYMGFLRSAGVAILSASPELLLELGGHGAERRARTRPIKGTIERGVTPAADRANAARLLASEKDRRELAMIVDLERNDLGRVSRAGSVRVEGFPTLERYATVHHLAADVLACPRVEAGPLDVLASLFPGGSITGAPKLRSMEVIAELEGEGRGFAFGSLGLLDLRGKACFNLLIRTPLWRRLPGGGGSADGEPRGEVTYRVGGGITWASDPAAEDAECLAKGRALAAALAGEGR